MAATLLPNAKQQFFDANGNPLAAGTVTFYVPGTSTLKATYQDAAQTISNTNPIILDAAGEAIIFGSGAYRQLVKDSLGNTIWDQLTYDTSLPTGTSTTSLAIALGSKTFFTQPGLGFVAGMSVNASAAGSDFMAGTVTAYNVSTGQLDVNVLSIGGSGVSSFWTIALTGPAGPAPIISGTSTTSNTIGAGSKSFTTQAGILFSAGQIIIASSTASPANYMVGTVTSYSGTSLVMNSTVVGGSGSFASWTISISGPQGPQGTLGNLTANYVLLGNDVGTPQTVAPGTSGNVLTSNGTTWISQALSAGGSGQQTFTSNGTWTKPSGYSTTASVLIECWGAGGGGSYVSGNGVNGGLSSFGTWITAYGGTGGAGGSNGGASGGYASTATAGSRTNDSGFEGIGSNGTTAATGGFYTGGAGGGGGSGSGTVIPGANSVYGGGGGGGTPSGAGGNSQFGGGGGAAGNGGTAGTNGTAPGGGGGGGTAGMTTGGGGGGSYKYRNILLSSLGATETVTVGTGGAGASNGGNGANGQVRITVRG